jgi:hypothetical protein
MRSWPGRRPCERPLSRRRPCGRACSSSALLTRQQCRCYPPLHLPEQQAVGAGCAGWPAEPVPQDVGPCCRMSVQGAGYVSRVEGDVSIRQGAVRV